MRRAVQDRLLECLLRARVDIFGGEGLLLLRDLRDCLREITALGLAAAGNARFVEVDVGFDETRHDQASAEVQAFGVRLEACLEGNESALVDADIDTSAPRAVVRALRKIRSMAVFTFPQADDRLIYTYSQKRAANRDDRGNATVRADTNQGPDPAHPVADRDDILATKMSCGRWFKGGPVVMNVLGP